MLLYKLATKARHLCCGFKNWHHDILSEIIFLKGSNNLKVVKKMFLYIVYILDLQIFLLISVDKTKTIICTMNDVYGDLLGPSHSTPSVAVIANKIRKQKNFHRENEQRARWRSGRASDSESIPTSVIVLCPWARHINSLQYWLNPGSVGSVPTWLKNCWLGR